MHRILIVDNNEQSIYLLRTILESKGYAVEAAENGSEALNMARQNPPALIISDILMPVMDGFTLCREWMRDTKLAPIPFVLYTATYTDAADEELGLSLGAARFLLKPQDGDTLAAIIQELLKEPYKQKFHSVHTAPETNESDQYRLYSEALVRKLDAKVIELEATRRVLQHQIEERRQADAALRLHAKVFEQAHEGIMITDAQEQILSVNGSFSLLTGFDEEDLIGKQAEILRSDRHAAAFHQEIRREVTGGGRWQGEVWIRNKAGEAQPVWLSVSALTDARDRVTHHISLMLDLGEKKMQAAQIEKLAFFDTITGLPNRALLIDRLEQILANAARRSATVAIFFLNLTRFKEINETRGHAAGDAVLREATRRFNTALGSETFLARFGGDEFVAVADHTDQTESAFIAESLALCLEKPLTVGNDVLHVSVRIGIALSPTDGSSADTLIRHADTAMHRARAAGKNHMFFRTEMSAQAARKLQIAGRLVSAIHEGALDLHYQPQFSLASGLMSGAEALLRWNDAELGIVNPGEFIPIAEERGLATMIGDYVFSRTCEHARTWREAGLALPAKLSVNVSAFQLHDAAIAQRFKNICSAAGLMPQNLEIELTETGAMSDPEHAMQVLLSLKQAGFSLAIDDFGVGHSSLVYIKRFAADKLKIDMSFVRGMLSDANDRAIVTAIINMAKGLGMRTIAEGVEQVAQADLLRTLGCDDVQGFYFGAPVSPTEFVGRWLRA